MGILFPARCVGCQRVLPYNRKEKGICCECEKKMESVKGQVCARCGKILRNPLDAYCKDCKKYTHFFLQGKALFVYTGPMKMAMYKLKYSNARWMVKFFARETKKRYGGWLKEIQPDCIIPVPMFHKKKRQRGYNQAEVFAKALSKEIHIPVENNLVIRGKNTIPQKGLDFFGRQKNLKNAFKLNRNNVKLNCVLIVDDIYTTGSTMDAIAKLLQKKGVEKIFCLTICIGTDV
ncbi:MAG: ComF family protein [Lachnospiraceae bacterium]|nr:ComF family protein [Lachnospiraceae bacterium]